MTAYEELLYLLPYIGSMLFPLALGLFVRRRNKSRTGNTFSILLFEQAAWSVTIFIEIVWPDIRGKAFWDDLQFLGSGIAAVLTLAFSLRYEGAWFKRGNKTFAALMIYTAVPLLFALTNDWHGLHRFDAVLDESVPFGELAYSFGVPMTILLLPVYVMAVAGVARLGAFSSRSRGARRKGATMAFLGLLIPLVGTILAIVGVRINGRLNASSLWLMVGDALVAVGIFRYRMAGVLPVARNRILENLHNPVLVLDRDGIILDCNKAVGILRDGACRDIKGRNASEVFSSWPPEGIGMLEGRASRAEMTIDARRKTYHVLAQSFPVRRFDGSRVMVLEDITALKTAERSLRDLSGELERTVEVRVAELEAEVRLRRAAEEQLESLNAEIEKTRNEVMLTLSEIIENRGRETARHVMRVAEYSRVLGLAAGLSTREAEALAGASAMHDIGKISIPDSVLLDRGCLEGAELESMRCHTLIGHGILAKSDDPLMREAAVIALEHHERWDGSGYPRGKKGGEISLDARIVGLCDVFDSLMSERPYRRGRSLPETIEHLRGGRGTLFDPYLVDLLLERIDKFVEITELLKDDSSAYGDVEALAGPDGEPA